MAIWIFDVLYTPSHASRSRLMAVVGSSSNHRPTIWNLMIWIASTFSLRNDWPMCKVLFSANWSKPWNNSSCLEMDSFVNDGEFSGKFGWHCYYPTSLLTVSTMETTLSNYLVTAKMKYNVKRASQVCRLVLTYWHYPLSVDSGTWHLGKLKYIVKKRLFSVYCLSST